VSVDSAPLFETPGPVDWPSQSRWDWRSCTDLIAREPGVVTMRGKLARILIAIEEDFRGFALSLGAEAFSLPGSLSRSDLDRTGTLARFPHLVTFLSTLENPEKALQAPANLREPERACCSAVCLPAYPCFEGKVFAPGEQVVLMASGPCYRNEVLDARSIERLSEFHVSEVIFLGNAEFIQRALARCEAWMKELLVDCDLRGLIQAAEDPFFSAQANTLGAYQRIRRTKLELCLEKPGDGMLVAVGSLNDHETHFAKSYHIRFANGDYVHSACFGLGLERALFLFLFQHGADEAHWPEQLRKRFWSGPTAPVHRW
jgi:seryl-tRNA synthetase